MSAFLTWYKRKPADCLDDAASMTLEFFGAYTVLLDNMFLFDRALHDDEAYVAGLLKVSTRRWRSIRAELLACGKITVVEGKIDNASAKLERESRANQARKRAEAGRAGGEKSGESRKSNTLIEADASPKPKQIREEDRIGEHPPNPPKGGDYESQFEVFRKRWGVSDANHPDTRDLFDDLGPTDGSKAIDGIAAYLAETSMLNRKRCSARRYLKERRWERSLRCLSESGPPMARRPASGCSAPTAQMNGHLGKSTTPPRPRAGTATPWSNSVSCVPAKKPALRSASRVYHHQTILMVLRPPADLTPRRTSERQRNARR
jgi:uncharacterized protein YdaU (DUF1376 family)